MGCRSRRRRHQATVQLAPLHSRHRRVHRDRRNHCRRHHCSHHRCHRNRRRHRRRNHRRSHGRRHHRRRSHRRIHGRRHHRRRSHCRRHLSGQQRRERAGQVGCECSDASDGRTGHRRRRSLRISTVPCRSWPCVPFARTVHSGAPSRWTRAAIPLGAILRRWYRRRMAPRDRNSPSAGLTANGGAAVAAGGWNDGCLHRETRTAVCRVHFRSTYHRLSAVLHTLHGWSGTLH